MIFKKMLHRSRKRTSLLLATTFGGILSLLLLPIAFFNNYLTVKNTETHATELEVLRIENLIQEKINSTSNLLRDWSNWDDTYQYVQDSNQEFTETNFSSDTILNLDINAIVVLNSSGQILFSGYFDPYSSSSTQCPIDFQTLVNSYPELTDFSSVSDYKGLAYDQGRVMIIAANPVLTSKNKGPAKGTMIFIKLMDERTINELSQLTIKKINLFAADSLPSEISIFPSPEKLNNDIYILPKDKDTIFGFKYLNDIRGDPLLILQVENFRDLYLLGQKSRNIIIVIIISVILLLSVILYFTINATLRVNEHQKEEEIAEENLKKARLNALLLEEKVIERTRELEIKNNDLTTFNYAISHDLKTPLRGISSFSSLLISEHAVQLDKTGLEYLQYLVGATERMNRLIDDLLLYNRTEQHEIVKTDIDLEALLNSLIMEFREEFLKRNIIVNKKLECKRLDTDRDVLILILRNLLDNAIKFTQEDHSPEITISSQISLSNYLLSVTDNGIGFDEKFHDKMFDIFQKLHLDEEYPGTGVGLALVKKAAERIGGRVYAQSQVGKGSTFYLEIPLY